jgi:3-isopropylmalate dehydrogenase
MQVAPMRDATIALLPGDGIGPEVVSAARHVLDAVATRYGLTLRFPVGLIGGAAIESTGSPLPDDVLSLCRESDAVLLGAVGGPQWDDPAAVVRPEQGLLGLRRALGLSVNVRPVQPYPSLAHCSPLRADVLSGVDLVVVRELTGGIYFGRKELVQIEGSERASDLCSYGAEEIERVVRAAAGIARARRGRLTSVDKANVLETSRLWRRVATRIVATEFPDVRLDHMLVDSCAMRIMQRPSEFDVIVTENMFGDILTDEAAVLAGSIGLLPSASLGEQGESGRRPGLYEPIHGSAPDIAGQERANPLGTILSAALLLRHSLGLEEEACSIEHAVRETIAEGVLTADLTRPGDRPATTSAVASRVAELVARPSSRRAATAPRRRAAADRAG